MSLSTIILFLYNGFVVIEWQFSGLLYIDCVLLKSDSDFSCPTSHMVNHTLAKTIIFYSFIDVILICIAWNPNLDYVYLANKCESKMSMIPQGCNPSLRKRENEELKVIFLSYIAILRPCLKICVCVYLSVFPIMFIFLFMI